MVQHLRIPATLPEDLFGSQNPLVVHNHSSVQFQEIRHPLLASTGTAYIWWYTFMYAGKKPTHIKINLKNLKENNFFKKSHTF